MRELLQCFQFGVEHRHKYPPIVRKFCLMILYHSTQAYSSVRTFFRNKLPHIWTVRSWCVNSEIECSPGISDSCLNILKRKVEAKKLKGKKLLVSISFDEMHIKRFFQWCQSKKELFGAPTFGIGNLNGYGKLDIAASQAIVFMANGIDQKFNLPFAYHFIRSLKSGERKALVEEILERVIATGATVTNITFDGYGANGTMCKQFGANLDFRNPQTFKPYFTMKNGARINIVYDACHVEKLIRNTIANRGVIIDENGKEVKWEYFQKLLLYNDKTNFNITHKLTKEHINFQNKKMKVILAVQTLSNSTANAMKLLKEKGYLDFAGADATIDFISLFNILFDTCNSKNCENTNRFKNAISEKNKREVFNIFEQAKNKILEWKIKNDKGKLVPLVTSKNKTGFCGYIITTSSIQRIYNDYVETGDIEYLPTYSLSQDPLEIFFGKIRSHCGHNDNPTPQQFMAAYRKLLIHTTIFKSTHANCEWDIEYDMASQPFSNVLFATSRRATIQSSRHFVEPPLELDEIYIKLDEIEAMEQSGLIDTCLKGVAIIHVAREIESRLKTIDTNCDECKNIFQENSDDFTPGNPSPSTVAICKIADRFLNFEFLKENFRFDAVQYAIYQEIDSSTLFRKTDFSHNSMHKLYVIRSIIDSYVQIKGSYIARNVNLETHTGRRNAYRKFIHRSGE